MGTTQVTLPAYRCERCGHTWVARLPRRPLICPRCKSAGWDIPKDPKGKED